MLSRSAARAYVAALRPGDQVDDTLWLFGQRRADWRQRSPERPDVERQLTVEFAEGSGMAAGFLGVAVATRRSALGLHLRTL
ncbi:MAG: hypothetical protein ACJ8IR_05215 [Alphaproteobacteria bacterium]|jgi:hypothetical protein